MGKGLSVGCWLNPHRKVLRRPLDTQVCSSGRSVRLGTTDLGTIRDKIVFVLVLLLTIPQGRSAVPLLEMRKLRLGDTESPAHSHRAGNSSGGDLK